MPDQILLCKQSSTEPDSGFLPAYFLRLTTHPARVNLPLKAEAHDAERWVKPSLYRVRILASQVFTTVFDFPIFAATGKRTEQGADDRFHYAVTEMQGWRITMEDAHTTILNLEEDSLDGNAFFAVYDGHGSSVVATYAGINVHKRLVQDEAYRKARGSTPPEWRLYSDALKQTFIGVDADMGFRRDFIHAGCTAVAALLTKTDIIVANAGDSRCVLSLLGIAMPLSHDHKPQNNEEKQRIFAAGGYIEYGRVNGNLSLSRALGDFQFKKNPALPAEAQIITSDPEIIHHQLTPEDEFIIIACDGIWDCLSSQIAVNVVRLLISQGKRLPEICEEICDLCLAPDTTSGSGIGCDNMTILIVALLQGRTQDEWYQWVTDRVKSHHGHEPPESLPQLYSATRLRSYRVKMEAYGQAQRERTRPQQEKAATEPSTPPTEDHAPIPLSGYANILGGDGSLIQSVSDADDDSDDDDDLDSHGINARSLLSNEGFRLRPLGYDVTKSLRDQLRELDDMGMFNEGDAELGDGEKAAHERTSEPDSPTYTYNGSTFSESRGTETPPPPPTPPSNETASPVQLKPLPDGDAPSAALKAEGFLDSSESPLKV